MEYIGLNEIRERFLTFFEGKQHLRLKSAPLVPQDDASLLLINSGMAPLKKYFLGVETPPAKRAASCQKCIRTPDIERVGKTSRHGTFFEMLGNFSFGDYFKEEATTWAWEFITEEMKIPVDRLWVSIYQDDNEAFDIWTKHRGVAAERIVRLGKEDNFWEIGTGPCGPCSEIYYDRGAEHGCDNPNCAVGCDCDRYVEFWNLVFTQFNSDGEGNYPPLAKPNIDTGMGLERLACIMQGVGNLFEVDTVQNIMKHIAKIAGVEYKKDEKTDISLRVITDHIRSTVFLVGDGVVPQNEGRGYVLRRLLRRAARHGFLLGIKKPFLFEVCDTVIDENRIAYPDLYENREYIKKIIGVEEERFVKTIEAGMEMLNSLIEKTPDGGMISGVEAFKLYDTFGFPVDLTKEIAEDKGLTINEDEFSEQMKLQRERARKAHDAKGDVSWEDDVLAELHIKDSFTGYDKTEASTKILAVVKDGVVEKQVCEGDEAVIVLEETPFYAESGGQVGDTGVINVGKSLFQVTGCKKAPSGNFLHIGIVKSGALSVGDKADAHIDIERRRAIMRNHTATHLLQAALREVVGSHVHQSGSLVTQDACRFDFTHFSAVTPDQLKEVEQKVNERILEALPVGVSEMGIDEAKKLGAMALFGDKYGNIVRVCDISGKSVELCGGTHVKNTSEIGLFKILGESSVAAGIRRIEGVTGAGVLKLIDSQTAILHKSSEALKLSNPNELPEKLAATVSTMHDLQKQLQQQNAKMAGAELDNLTDKMTAIGPVRHVSAVLGGSSIDTLKSAADKLKDKVPDIVGVLSTMDAEKATLLVFAGKDAVKAGIHAGKLVREIAELAGGSGGGRPDNAMGGASELGKVNDALLAAPEIIKKMLNL